MAQIRLVSACVFILFVTSKLEAAKIPISRESFVSNVGGYAEGDNEYLLPEEVRPSLYTVTLDPDLDAGTFTGIISITLSSLQEVSNITLHRDASITIDSRLLYLNDRIPMPISLEQDTYDEETQFHVFTPVTPLVAGDEYILLINYHGVLHEDMAGFYRSTYTTADGEERYLATTQFEPTDARRAYPCFDQPGFKAQFQINIIRSANMRSISNTRKVDEVEQLDGRIMDVFNVTPPMSTYLVAFIVSDFEVMSTISEGRTYEVWMREEAMTQGSYSVSISPRVIQFMETFTEVAFEFDLMQEAAIPDFSAGAMENWGLVTYRERMLLLSEESSTSADKQGIAQVIAHEFAHQWFGDLVSPEWWSFLWLNEGFATYFGAFAAKEVETEWRLDEQFVVEEHQIALEADAVNTTHPISNGAKSPADINGIFDSITYEKAGAVIRTWEHFLGYDNFRIGLSNYLKGNMHTAVTPVILFQALSDETGTDLGDPDLNVVTILTSWTEQSGYPLVILERGETETTISQKRFFITGDIEDDTLWWIPISYTTSETLDFTDTKPKLWLKNENDTIIDEVLGDNWILLNIHATGFYRVLYDEHNYHLLTEYLTNENNQFVNIPPMDRAQLLDDVFSLAQAGYLTYDVPLSLSTYLSRDADYIPWKTYFSKISYLDGRLAGTELYPRFKQYVLDLLGNLYNSVGFYVRETDDHVTKLNRMNLLKWACNYGHSGCLDISISQFNTWMDTSASNYISPDTKSAVYCAGIKNGGDHHWGHLWDRYTETDVSAEQVLILAALGCSSNTDQLNNYLSLSINETSGIRVQDSQAVFSAVYGRPEGVQIALDFLINNFQDIQSYYVAMNALGRIITGIASKLTTQAQYDQLSEFIEAHRDEFGSAAGVVDSALETVLSNLDWYNRNQEVLSNWLPQVTDGGDGGDDGGDGSSQLTVLHPLIFLAILISYFLVK